MSPLARDLATFAMRLAAFAVALGTVGAFFLPWVRLDGVSRASSGAELVALVASPTAGYLFEVSALQAVVLIGGPVLLLVAAVVVMAKYGQRKTAPLATTIVVALALALAHGTPDLTVGRPHLGLSIVTVLSIVLLLHQVLIRLCADLYARNKLPFLYRVLSVATGSGYQRWEEQGPWET